jgi:predicted transcriptional regulator
MTGLLKVIEELKKEHGSINAAARAVGMPQATLHNMAKGEEEPRLDNLRKIARARHQPLWKLVKEIESGSH